MTDTSPLEALRLALGGAARAMAREPELELAYTADAPLASGKHIKVPMPSRGLPPDQVAEARGAADGFALRLRHHDPKTHAKAAPVEAVARAVFDAVEQARVEALGSRGMAGVGANLSSALAARFRSDPLVRARNRDEVPLSSALQLLVRERLTGETPPPQAAAGLALVRDWIEAKAGADLDALGLALDDQRAFAKLATRLLEDLELVTPELAPDADPDAEATSRRATIRTATTRTRAKARTRAAPLILTSRPAPRRAAARMTRTPSSAAAMSSPRRPRASPARKARRECSPSAPIVRRPIRVRSSTIPPLPPASTR